MSFYAGIDVGSLCTKAVIINSNYQIEAYSIIRSGAVYKGAGETALNEALKRASLKQDELDYIISTGYGRARVPFSNGQITEISCHGRGANFVFPEVRGVIDIGGQDSKVIEINAKGQAIKFVMNDKCAAGTGRFLEVMANSLEVSLDEMSELAIKSQSYVEISSMCTVFAESEVISLFAEGADKADIAASIYRSIARRVTGLAGQIAGKERIAMTGGVAKSKGMVRALEESLGTKLFVPEEPQIIGAFGAAINAHDRSLISE
jgi:predicted CoA-substrate-specific enzyme activase